MTEGLGSPNVESASPLLSMRRPPKIASIPLASATDADADWRRHGGD
jgi:hypothetical protein